MKITLTDLEEIVIGLSGSSCDIKHTTIGNDDVISPQPLLKHFFVETAQDGDTPTDCLNKIKTGELTFDELSADEFEAILHDPKSETVLNQIFSDPIFEENTFLSHFYVDQALSIDQSISLPTSITTNIRSTDLADINSITDFNSNNFPKPTYPNFQIILEKISLAASSLNNEDIPQTTTRGGRITVWGHKNDYGEGGTIKAKLNYSNDCKFFENQTIRIYQNINSTFIEGPVSDGEITTVVTNWESTVTLYNNIIDVILNFEIID